MQCPDIVVLDDFSWLLEEILICSTHSGKHNCRHKVHLLKFEIIFFMHGPDRSVVRRGIYYNDRHNLLDDWPSGTILHLLSYYYDINTDPLEDEKPSFSLVVEHFFDDGRINETLTVTLPAASELLDVNSHPQVQEIIADLRNQGSHSLTYELNLKGECSEVTAAMGKRPGLKDTNVMPTSYASRSAGRKVASTNVPQTRSHGPPRLSGLPQSSLPCGQASLHKQIDVEDLLVSTSQDDQMAFSGVPGLSGLPQSSLPCGQVSLRKQVDVEDLLVSTSQDDQMAFSEEIVDDSTTRNESVSQLLEEIGKESSPSQNDSVSSQSQSQSQSQDSGRSKGKKQRKHIYKRQSRKIMKVFHSPCRSVEHLVVSPQDEWQLSLILEWMPGCRPMSDSPSTSNQDRTRSQSFYNEQVLSQPTFKSGSPSTGKTTRKKGREKGAAPDGGSQASSSETSTRDDDSSKDGTCHCRRSENENAGIPSSLPSSGENQSGGHSGKSSSGVVPALSVANDKRLSSNQESAVPINESSNSSSLFSDAEAGDVSLSPDENKRKEEKSARPVGSEGRGKEREERGKEREERGKEREERGKEREERGKEREERGKEREERGKEREEQRKEREEQRKEREEQGNRVVTVHEETDKDTQSTPVLPAVRSVMSIEVKSSGPVPSNSKTRLILSHRKPGVQEMTSTPTSPTPNIEPLPHATISPRQESMVLPTASQTQCSNLMDSESLSLIGESPFLDSSLEQRFNIIDNCLVETFQNLVVPATSDQRSDRQPENSSVPTTSSNQSESGSSAVENAKGRELASKPSSTLESPDRPIKKSPMSPAKSPMGLTDDSVRKIKKKLCSVFQQYFDKNGPGTKQARQQTVSTKHAQSQAQLSLRLSQPQEHSSNLNIAKSYIKHLSQTGRKVLSQPERSMQISQPGFENVNEVNRIEFDQETQRFNALRAVAACPKTTTAEGPTKTQQRSVRGESLSQSASSGRKIPARQTSVPSQRRHHSTDDEDDYNDDDDTDTHESDSDDTLTDSLSQSLRKRHRVAIVIVPQKCNQVLEITSGTLLSESIAKNPVLMHLLPHGQPIRRQVKEEVIEISDDEWETTSLNSNQSHKRHRNKTNLALSHPSKSRNQKSINDNVDRGRKRKMVDVPSLLPCVVKLEKFPSLSDHPMPVKSLKLHSSYKDTGLCNSHKDPGHSNSVKDMGNSNSHKDTRHPYSQKDVGNFNSVKDRGNSNSVNDTGNSNSLNDTGNSNSLNDTGHSYSVKDTGNSNSLNDTGNSNSLNDIGNSNSVKDTGNSNSDKDTGNSNSDKDAGNSNSDKDAGRSKSNSMEELPPCISESQGFIPSVEQDNGGDFEEDDDCICVASQGFVTTLISSDDDDSQTQSQWYG